MERRLLSWFIASTAFLLFYMALQAMILPPPPRVAEVAEEDAAERRADPVERPAREAIEPDRPDDPDAVAEPVDDEDEEPRPQTPTRITLGSMDPESGYFLLATFNTRGGAVERLELTERRRSGRLKYRRVDTRSGYLGYLAAGASPTLDGCIVNVIGPGTPAALAEAEGSAPDGSILPPGLQVDDVIIAVGGRAVSSPYGLGEVLEDTAPGDRVSIEVIRPSVSDQPLRFVTRLTEHPLDLVRLSSTGGVDEIMGNLDRLSCRVTLSHFAGRDIPTGKAAIEGLEWVGSAIYDHEVSVGDGGVADAVFTLPLSARRLGPRATGAMQIERSYTLRPGSYLIDMDVAVRNLGDQPQAVGYRLEGPNGITPEGWWYSTKISPNFFGGAAARDVVYRTARDGHRLISGYDLLKRAKKTPVDPDPAIFGADEPEPSRLLDYVGVDAQYFNVAYLPPEETDHFRRFRRASATIVADPQTVPVHKERAVNVSFYVDSSVAEVPPGAAMREPLRMFAGPKQPELIDSVGLSATIEYGWFGGVSKLLGGILHVLNRLAGNYALAIILLTVLVRACLFPISRNAAVQAQRMQELAPELKKIAEKYKDDMEGRLKAQRDFQKRVGFNPLAGCLPALLQLPIFIGLYRTLSVDIELRQEAISPRMQWADNLAGPDMLFYWGDWLWDYLSGRGTGWLGPYFNILPIIVVVLFLIQQKMFMPPPTDEQTRMTQRVMTIMTLMMLLFFFRVPAGLCVYFITSSLWGIVERIVVKKTLPPSKPVPAFVDGGQVVEGKVAGGAEKPKTLAERIREQIKPEPPKPLPPKKRKRPAGRK